MKNELLREKELQIYDFVKGRNLVLEIFKLLKYLKRKDDKIKIPRITSDYRVRYEQFVFVPNSQIENCVFSNLMLESRLENKRRRLLSKITLALRKLNEEELKAFDLTFYKSKGEDETAEIMSYCVDTVRGIKKSSVIKFLTALGLEDRCLR